MSTEKIIALEISNREADLILEYGYPFPKERKLFEEAAKTEGLKKINIPKCWLELIISDLYRSIRETDSYQLQEELDELGSMLESELKANENPQGFIRL